MDTECTGAGSRRTFAGGAPLDAERAPFANSLDEVEPARGIGERIPFWRKAIRVIVLGLPTESRDGEFT